MADDNNSEARFDFQQLSSSLSTLRNSIRAEQQKAQREIFRTFMVEVLRLEVNDEAFINLEESYIGQLDQLTNEKVSLHDRVDTFVNSDFLYSVLTVKNLRYEREIKTFLKHLQLVLKNTTTESSENDMRYIQAFLETSLKDISQSITQDDIPTDIPNTIIESLLSPLNTWFKRV